MGKQAVDGDTNQVGQLLAELLDWPMATFAATIKEEDGALLVGREVDGGVLTLRVKLPAVVTVDLRIVAPTSVYSQGTTRGRLQVQRRRALRAAARDHGREEEAARRRSRWPSWSPRRRPHDALPQVRAPRRSARPASRSKTSPSWSNKLANEAKVI